MCTFKDWRGIDTCPDNKHVVYNTIDIDKIGEIGEIGEINVPDPKIAI